MSLFFKENPLFLLKNPDLTEAFQNIMVPEKYTKGDILSKAGTVCNYFYIIISGSSRMFYSDDGQDITVHFSMEHESVSDTSSFWERKESKYSIEALEDMEVMAVSYQDLEKLFKSQPEYERIARLFIQQLYSVVVERLDDLLLNNAQKRYENLLSKKPELFQRVPLKYIASFLGITPETLSRIRGK